jgi:hypothetical protein
VLDLGEHQRRRIHDVGVRDINDLLGFSVLADEDSARDLDQTSTLFVQQILQRAVVHALQLLAGRRLDDR